MKAKLVGAILLAAFTLSAYANEKVELADISMAGSPQNVSLGDGVPTLAGGVQVDQMQACLVNIHHDCDKFQSQAWEQYNNCVTQYLVAQSNLCLQTQALYQKQGVLPDQVQEIGPIALFTVTHLGDGQQTFHMIDQAGHIIDLVDAQYTNIQNSSEFQALQKKYPGAGVMPLVVGAISQIPQVKMPQAFANTKENDVIQLIFPQWVNNPPCNACQNVAIANIAYRFSREGAFLGVEWLSTDAPKNN